MFKYIEFELPKNCSLDLPQITPENHHNITPQSLNEETKSLLHLFETACNDTNWLKRNVINFEKIIHRVSILLKNRQFDADQLQNIQKICERALLAPQEKILEHLIPEIFKNLLNTESALNILLRSDINESNPLKKHSQTFIGQQTKNAILFKKNNTLELEIANSNIETDKLLKIISELDEFQREKVNIHLKAPEKIEDSELETLFQKYGQFAEKVTLEHNIKSQKQIEKLFTYLNQVNHLVIKSLILEYIPPLKSPNILKTLDCNWCPNLKKLPKEYTALTTLDCSDCDDLSQLPKEYKKLIKLDCSECENLKNLPEEYVALRTLKCCGCQKIQRLPNTYKALTELNCGRCRKLQELPKTYTALVTLNCCDCKSLQQLPEEYIELIRLNCSQCDKLAFLSKNYSKLRKLDCSLCDNLIKLPKDYRLLKTLNCSWCDQLTKLPNEYQALTTLDCSMCVQLHELPKQFKALTKLNCNGCEKLEELPKEYVNLNTLNCSGCDYFKSLPKEYESLTTLICNWCNNLEEFPREYRSLTLLDCGWCENLKKLPKEYTALTSLYCNSCGKLEELPKEYLNLTRFKWDKCSSLSSVTLFSLLSAIYAIDKQRAINLLSKPPITYKVSDLILYSHFCPKNSGDAESLFKYFRKVNTEKIIQLIENNKKIKQLVYELEVSPLQQLFILNLCSNIRITENELITLKSFLSSIVMRPMDGELQNFYQSFFSASEVFLPLDIGIIEHLTREQKLQFLPYLMLTKSGWEDMLKNIDNLENSDLGSNFIENCSPTAIATIFLNKVGFFNGDQEHDQKSIEKIVFIQNDVSRLLLLSNQEIKEILQTPLGKVLAEKKANELLYHQRLQQIIMEVYSPKNPKNLLLYPILSKYSRYNQQLNLTMIASMPTLYPDVILNELRKFNNIRSIYVRYYGSPGIDEGGLGRQFMSQLIQGILTNSRMFQFEIVESNESGLKSYLPVNRVNPSPKITQKDLQAAQEKEKKDYEYLGEILGLALRMEYPIGEIFNEKLFSCIHCLNYEDLMSYKFSASKFLLKKNHTELITFIEEHLTETHERLGTSKEEHFLKIKTVLHSKDVGEIRSIAHELNHVWCDEKIEKLLEQEDCEAIDLQQLVKECWIEPYCQRLELFYVIAKGIRKALPLEINEILIQYWDHLQFITTDELRNALQGELNVDSIKDNLVFCGENAKSLVKIKAWLHEWFEDNKENKEALRNVIITFTGAPSLANRITFFVNNACIDVTTTSCTNSVNVPENATEEAFKARLDSWGEKPELHFTQP